MTSTELRAFVYRLRPLLQRRLPAVTQRLDRAEAEPLIRRLLDRILSSIKNR